MSSTSPTRLMTLFSPWRTQIMLQVGRVFRQLTVNAVKRLSSQARMPKSVNSAPSIIVKTADGRPESSLWAPMNPEEKSARFVSVNFISRTCSKIRFNKLRPRRCSCWDQVASTSSSKDKETNLRKSKPRKSRWARSLLLTTRSSKFYWRKSKVISSRNKGKTSSCRPQMTKRFKNRRKSKMPRMRSRVKLKGSLTSLSIWTSSSSRSRIT